MSFRGWCREVQDLERIEMGKRNIKDSDMKVGDTAPIAKGRK